MNGDRPRRRRRLEAELGPWLRARDGGPAPDRLRLRVSLVSSEPVTAAAWLPFARAVRPWLAVAAGGGVVAVGLALAAATEIRRPGASPPAAPSAPASWSWAGGGFLTPALVLWALAIVAVVGLVAVALERRARIRPPRRLPLLLVVALVVVLAAPGVLNVAGIVRYPGGPLCDSSDCGAPWIQSSFTPAGGVFMTSVPLGVERREFSGRVWNAGPSPLVVERAAPVVSDPGLVVDGVWLSRSRDPSYDVAAFDAEFSALPVEIPPEGMEGARVLAVVVHPTRPGYFRYDGIDVDYRVGPFRFHERVGALVEVCGVPMPAGYTCPVAVPGAT